MKVYAKKPNQPQPKASTHSGPQTRHKILNQRVTASGDAGANREAVTGAFATAPFAHDFSRILVHSKSTAGLQAKLVVNRPGDVYEQEADDIAERVMRTPEPRRQRACACGECPTCWNVQAASERLQTKRVEATDSGGEAAPPVVREILRSPGQPLDAATRAFFEPRFGHDFSRVRVHADSLADQANRSIRAHAFTYGRGIAFRRGAYDPGSIQGKTLLAHELTHTIQQSHGNNSEEAGGRVFNSGHAGAAAGSPKVGIGKGAGGVMKPTTAPGHKTSNPYIVQRQSSGATQTVREQIEAALKSRDAADVKAITDVNQATVEEKLELIRILLDQWWVGPRDELKIKELWESFGEELLPLIVKNKKLWDDCISAGAELKELLTALKAEVSGLEAATLPGSGKPFGEVGRSFTRLKDMRHDLEVLEKGKGSYEGNRCIAPTPGATRSDCTEFVIEVLGDIFTQQGRTADWAKIEKKYLQNRKARGAVKLTGLDIQAALQSEAGWKGIYWAPDPEYLVPKEELSGYDPRTGKGIQSEEAKYSYTRAKSKGTYYKDPKNKVPGVSVTHSVVNYAPEMPSEASRRAGHPDSKTKKDTTMLDKLKKLPFGVLTTHGARHMTIITNGKVVELHYDEPATSVDVIAQTDLERWAVGSGSGFHYFASGVIVAPASDVDAAFK